MSLRFRCTAITIAQLVVLQMAFTLVMFQFSLEGDSAPLAIVDFIVTFSHMLLALLLVVTHNYRPMNYTFPKRIGVCFYNMLAALKLLVYAGVPLCADCRVVSILRVTAALLENIASNVLFAHIWRRVEKQRDSDEFEIVPVSRHYRDLEKVRTAAQSRIRDPSDNVDIIVMEDVPSEKSSMVSIALSSKTN